ncbi:MAG: hypothetical protein V4556_08255 [Bacteroidota bacterium]
MARKKIVILFPLQHLAFSPTTLGLYDALSQHADVTIYAPLPKSLKAEDIGGRNVRFFKFDTNRSRKIKALPTFLLNKVRSIFDRSFPLKKLHIYDYLRYHEYKNALSENKDQYDEVIAVDMTMIYLSQFFYKNASFLSLELTGLELPLLKAVKNDFIKAVIVQTPQRYEYLFGAVQHKTFFVQNAPTFVPLPEINKKNNSLLYNGTAAPWFGLYQCLDFVKAYPQFSITLKGAVGQDEKATINTNYGDLIADGKIILNQDYMESKDMLAFLAQFEIGFCFYDLSFPKMNTFNYHTAPSGKMFAYFASGVPVIGNYLDGLKVVEDFQAGILVKDFSPATILEAVNKIKSNYSFYRDNCLKAAAHYSFDKNIAPFVDFIIK